jgi:hypothetical protein
MRSVGRFENTRGDQVILMISDTRIEAWGERVEFRGVITNISSEGFPWGGGISGPRLGS